QQFAYVDHRLRALVFPHGTTTRSATQDVQVSHFATLELARAIAHLPHAQNNVLLRMYQAPRVLIAHRATASTSYAEPFHFFFSFLVFHTAMWCQPNNAAETSLRRLDAS